MILVLQKIDRVPRLNKKPHAPVTFIPFIQLLGPVLYLSVVVFNISIAAIIGERQIAITSLFTIFLPFALILTLAIRRVNQYKRDELSAHLKDFPLSMAGKQ
jgi:putative membrane protein